MAMGRQRIDHKSHWVDKAYFIYPKRVSVKAIKKSDVVQKTRLQVDDVEHQLYLRFHLLKSADAYNAMNEQRYMLDNLMHKKIFYYFTASMVR